MTHGKRLVKAAKEAVALNVKKQASTILDDAAEVTSGDRRTYYGHPADNHGRTAAFWSTYLGIPINAEQVCYMNMLQKISRSMCSTTRDTLVDIAGFARNIEIMGEPR